MRVKMAPAAFSICLSIAVEQQSRARWGRERNPGLIRFDIIMGFPCRSFLERERQVGNSLNQRPQNVHNNQIKPPLTPIHNNINNV